MGDNPLIISQQGSNENKSISKKLSFFGVGILEVGFIVFLLGIIFWLLIFFHLLKLPSTFPTPSQFSFLKKTIPTPMPIAFSEGESNLKTYINNTVKPSLLPIGGISSIKIKKIGQGFQTTWKSKFDDTIIFHAIATYENNQSQLKYQEVSVYALYPPQIIAASGAANLAKVYFITGELNSDWNCSHLAISKNNIFCENFIRKQNSVASYLLMNPNTAKYNTTITTCVIPSKSSVFLATNSCLSLGI